jgi:hypothetical protein
LEKSILLDEIIAILLTICKNTDSQTQIDIIELTGCFNFQRQKDSLNIYDNNPNQQVTLLHLAGCKSVETCLKAWCWMSLHFRRPVVKTS